MTLYLDTSAVVKLYVREPGTDAVREGIARATMVATARIAYAEAGAALAAAVRLGRLSEPGRNEAMAGLRTDWPGFTVIEITQRVVEAAADWASAHGLRGYDAVHLAAATEYGRRTLRPLAFCGWDARLNEAARASGLALWPGPE